MGTHPDTSADHLSNTIEDRLRLVIDTTPALIHSGLPDGYLDFFNKRWLDYVGLSLDEIRGWRWTNTIHPEDVEAFVNKWRTSLAAGEPFEAEGRVRRADGEYRRFLHRKVPLRDEQGDIIKWYGWSIDIEDLRRAEDAVRRSQANLAEAQTQILQMVLDSMTDGVAVYREGRFGLFNPAARRLVGRVPVDLAPESWAGYVGLFQKDGTTPVPGAESPLARTLRGESTDETEFVIRNQLNPEGRIIAETARPVWDSEGHLYGGVAVLRDITDRRHAETRLLRAEKLSTVGRMAATIAHEINNPLAAVMNSLFLVSMDQSLSESARYNLNAAERELKRVVHITKLTLGFYKETGQPTAVEFPELVDEVLDLFASRIRNKAIRVIYERRRELRVEAVEGELLQIVSNLVANSIDAMSLNGVLHVHTTGSMLLNSRPIARLTIADSGTGINPENLSRIFEPFFTTKPSFGTGLGLWVTRELVNRQDGKIRVRSRVGKGTVVSVWLPIERREQVRLVA